MLKRDITYEDLDGNKITEPFYFNLTKTEILDMEVEHGSGGLVEWFNRIIRMNDHKALIQEFKKIILTAYGVRSEDGKKFIKNDALRDDFSMSMAYDALFFELATDDNSAANFLMGILPSEVRAEAEKLDREKLIRPNIRPAEEINSAKRIDLPPPVESEVSSFDQTVNSEG